MTKTTYGPGLARQGGCHRAAVRRMALVLRTANKVPVVLLDIMRFMACQQVADVRQSVLALLGFVALFWVVWSRAEAAPATMSSAPFVLICIAETPLVAPGATIPLRAWATTLEGEPLKSTVQYLWEVKTGSVTSQGNRAQWHVGDVQVAPNDRKTFRATVRVRDAEGTARACVIEVLVAQPIVPVSVPLRGRQPAPSPAPAPAETAHPEARIAGKALLLGNEPEEPGYGLYSYVLFGSKPSVEEAERYVLAIEAYLRALPNVADLADYVTRSELNITYIPVTSMPRPGDTARGWAEGILAVYDYARAKVLLSRLGEEYSGGPYLVCVRRPLTGQAAAPYLFMDLRRVVPSLVPSWIETFTWLTAKERSWGERSLKELGLNLRNIVKVTGIAIPEITQAIESWIRFVP